MLPADLVQLLGAIVVRRQRVVIDGPRRRNAVAMLDRLERTDGTVADDPRLKRVHEALDVLKKVKEDRAEQVQLTFSRPYDDGWQQTLKVKPR